MFRLSRGYRVLALLVAPLALATLAALPVVVGPASASVRPAATFTYPYQDPSLAVPARVADLLSRMSLADKIGQMTQIERTDISPADVTAYRIGSILSGGGSAPSPNTPAAWADM